LQPLDCFGVLHEPDNTVCSGCGDANVCDNTSKGVVDVQVLQLDPDAPRSTVKDYTLAQQLGYLKQGGGGKTRKPPGEHTSSGAPSPPKVVGKVRCTKRYPFRSNSTGEYMTTLLLERALDRYELSSLVQLHFSISKANAEMRTYETLAKMRTLNVLEDTDAAGNTSTGA